MKQQEYSSIKLVDDDIYDSHRKYKEFKDAEPKAFIALKGVDDDKVQIVHDAFIAAHLTIATLEAKVDLYEAKEAQEEEYRA